MYSRYIHGTKSTQSTAAPLNSQRMSTQPLSPDCTHRRSEYNTYTNHSVGSPTWSSQYQRPTGHHLTSSDLRHLNNQQYSPESVHVTSPQSQYITSPFSAPKQTRPRAQTYSLTQTHTTAPVTEETVQRVEGLQATVLSTPSDSHTRTHTHTWETAPVKSIKMQKRVDDNTHMSKHTRTCVSESNKVSGGYYEKSYAPPKPHGYHPVDYTRMQTEMWNNRYGSLYTKTASGSEETQSISTKTEEISEYNNQPQRQHNRPLYSGHFPYIPLHMRSGDEHYVSLNTRDLDTQVENFAHTIDNKNRKRGKTILPYGCNKLHLEETYVECALPMRPPAYRYVDGQPTILTSEGVVSLETFYTRMNGDVRYLTGRLPRVPESRYLSYTEDGLIDVESLKRLPHVWWLFVDPHS